MTDIVISGGEEIIPAAVSVSDVVEAPASDAEKAKQAALEAVEITSAERERLALEAERRISDHSETVEELDQWRDHQNQQMSQLQAAVERQEQALTQMQKSMLEVATMLDTVTAAMMADSTQEPGTVSTPEEVEIPPEMIDPSQSGEEDPPAVEVEPVQAPPKRVRLRRVI